MKLIVHGNPVDGLQFVGPFNSDSDIPERYTDPLNEWWIATLDEPDRSVSLMELTEDERWHLERERYSPSGDALSDLEAAIADQTLSIWRDVDGVAWASDDDTLYNLTAGTIPPTE